MVLRNVLKSTLPNSMYCSVLALILASDNGATATARSRNSVSLRTVCTVLSAVATDDTIPPIARPVPSDSSKPSHKSCVPLALRVARLVKYVVKPSSAPSDNVPTLHRAAFLATLRDVICAVDCAAIPSILPRAIRLAAPRLMAELIRASGPATPVAKPSTHALAQLSVAVIVTSFCLANSSLPSVSLSIAAHCSGLALARSATELAAICSRAELITSASVSSALPTELKRTVPSFRTVCAVLAHPAAAAGTVAALRPGTALAAVKPRLTTVVPAATASEPELSVRSVVG